MKSITTQLLVILICLGFNACKENDPKPSDKPVNESELITTIRLKFTDSASGSTRTFSFRDPDGEGGNPPVQFDTIALDTQRAYSMQVLLLDESKSPVDTPSNEVWEERDEHLFVFGISSANVTVSIADKDANNLPVGLLSRWRTGGKSSGTARILLKHQPGVKDGTADPGESDIDIAFEIRIK